MARPPCFSLSELRPQTSYKAFREVMRKNVRLRGNGLSIAQLEEAMDDILTSKGRCVSCAFLAKRVIDKSGRFVSPRYYEIDEDGRVTGAVWKSLADPLIGQIDSMPFCFVRAVQLHTEIARRIGIEDKVQATREVFRADRNCQSWQRYNAGYGPKEQHEQLNMERVVEQAGKAFERHMEKATKEFEMKLSAFSEQVHVSNKTIVKRFTIGAIILLFFQVWLVLGQSQNLSPNLKLQMSRLVGSITEIFSRKAE